MARTQLKSYLNASWKVKLGASHRGVYLITLVACSRTAGGIVRSRAFAVFKLMMKSNFVGCSMGRSAGFAPLRILAT